MGIWCGMMTVFGLVALAFGRVMWILLAWSLGVPIAMRVASNAARKWYIAYCIAMGSALISTTLIVLSAIMIGVNMPTTVRSAGAILIYTITAVLCYRRVRVLRSEGQQLW
jgi:hypothetical protein